MRKLLLILFLCPVVAFSQPLHVTLFGGVSNYSGDLQNKGFTLDQSNVALGLGLSYDLTNHLSVRTNFTYGKLQADDKKSSDPLLQARNLNFQTSLVEGNLLLEYTFLDIQTHAISPYVFGGVAVFHYNPYSYDTLGNKIYLKPLSTEGEGLSQYPDRKPYSLTQFAVPFGGGVKFRINARTVLAYEIGLRRTFTDYLDDVSKTYVDANALALARGAKAVEMAYRGGELKNGSTAYPADGSIRGGSKYDDWYYFTGFTLYIGLGKGRGLDGNHQWDCPRPVN